ncbi:MAG: UvrD-helicase domain-containing protein, partial [Oleibacter sp.]|nr:UvrD-helicase domain-containing protein [Thalassolituus sp.]
MKPLDIHTFPLQGQSLIEASAGTGKTYTINQLYRRLILGHGDAPKRLSCTDVLVVTFTKAATEELRGRIRSGLREAYEALLSVDHAGSFADITDPDIRRWVSELYFDALAALDEQEDQQAYLLQLRTWLQVNLAQMDESSIYTIHRFCAQILKRFAFDSGVAFNVAMETEGEVYLRRACEDVWRRECYPSSAEQLAAITQHWSSPESVFHYFRSWVAKSNLTIRPEIKEDYLTLWQKFHACRNEIKTLWFLLSSEGLDKAIFDADIDKRSYSQKHYPNWKQQIGDYLLTGVLLPLPVNLPRFGAALLHEKTKKGEPPKHLLFEKIDALIALEQQLSMALELKWFNAVYQRYLELLEQAAVMTSDDLLRLLDDALQSERGSELAAQIRALYPVAMIDEFQDTDSIQYRIFNTLYPP